ncbi:MAG: rhamnulose-1-phosphate aldolase [Ignavibacteria bacterium]|nr:rhamnulose-1-phosphate aldolase [Ignavibacteria bacterium]
MQDIIQDIIDSAELLCQRNWAERNAGNISYNISENISFSQLKEFEHEELSLSCNYEYLKNTAFFITATGSKMRDLKRDAADGIVIVAFAEETDKCYIFSFSGQSKKPSSELPSHLLIHNFLIKNKSSYKAILHTHSTELIAFSHSPEIRTKDRLNDILFRIHPELSVLIPKGFGFVPYQITGSVALAEATLTELARHDCVIWEKHGCLAVAEKVVDCFDSIDILTKAVGIYLMCKSAGYTPTGLSDSQLAELKSIFNIESISGSSQLNNINSIIELIDKSNDIIILTHINVDGDAIGSSLAVKEYCKAKGKDANIFIDGEVSENFNFINSIQSLAAFDQEKHTGCLKKADLIVILDLNDSSRLGEIENAFLSSNAKKIVIDHHLEPKIKADLYLIDSKSSSTAELVWSLIKSDSKIQISEEIANHLYFGIMSDTGNFVFNNTSSSTFLAASELVCYGAKPNFLYNSYYNSVPARQIKLFGKALSEIKFYLNEQLCILVLNKKMFEETNTSLSDTDNFVEKLMTIKNIKIAIQITAIDDKELKLSFRSKEGINIREIAVKYGGGGHSQAAGARVKNVQLLEFIEKLVLDCENLNLEGAA